MSSAPSLILTVTPLGSEMGFFPMRDIALPLPNVAEHFTADASPHRVAAGHDTARCRQDAGAEPAEHGRHLAAAEVDTPARAADALDARYDFLAPGTVFE